MSPHFRGDFVLDFGVSLRTFVESEPKTRRFRFGVFQLDALSRELYKHGTRIKLQEQPFQVLVMLLDRPGEVVSREELRKGVLTSVVVGFGHIPTGLKAPAIVQPKGLPAEQVRGEVRERIVAMDAIIAQCEACFGRWVHVLDHPILGPLNAPQWRKLHVVHGQHLLKQLLQLREGATRHVGVTQASRVSSH